MQDFETNPWTNEIANHYDEHFTITVLRPINPMMNTAMATYHTEGIVKSIEIVDSRPTIRFEPVSPYKFTEKKDDKEFSRILFVNDEQQTPRTIAVFTQTSKFPGVFTDFGDITDGEVSGSAALSLLCSTKRGHRVFTLQCCQASNPDCQSAILLKDDTRFFIKPELAKTVDFAALLALKQDRIKIRMWISYDPTTVSSPVEITNVKICE